MKTFFSSFTLQLEGSQASQCSVSIEPMSGEIDKRETKDFTLHFTPHMQVNNDGISTYIIKNGLVNFYRNVLHYLKIFPPTTPFPPPMIRTVIFNMCFIRV